MVYQLMLSDSITCLNAVDAKDCAIAEKLLIDIIVTKKGGLMAILLISTVVLGLAAGIYFFVL